MELLNHSGAGWAAEADGERLGAGSMAAGQLPMQETLVAEQLAIATKAPTSLFLFSHCSLSLKVISRYWEP